MSNRRSSKSFPILGVCGILLFAVGAWAVASDAFACPNCNCYYSSDCASGQSCNWSSGCRVWYAAGKKVDGTCTGAAGAVGIEASQSAMAAQAMSYWMQAYEAAGRRGGDPDAGLISKALSVPLTPLQQGAIRRAAINAESLLFGIVADEDNERALFTAPNAETVIICQVDPTAVTTANVATLENGSLAPLGKIDAGAAGIVREAMISELAQPYHGNFAKVMQRLPKELPQFATYGVCEFPRADGGRFPFKDGLDCLNREMLRVVHSLLVTEKGDDQHGGKLWD
ncbi:MAG TPA: hypothetical protein VOA87_05970 [Thermoanaerobaculia bacterium]|nr:hypothetical protein [Thermoanaerobaculia bacterium]